MKKYINFFVALLVLVAYNVAIAQNYKWAVYDSSNTTIKRDKIKDLFIDNAGDKWFATYSGATKFDDSNWITYDTSSSNIPKDAELEMYSIAVQGDSLIHIGTCGGGLIVFNINKDEWQTFRPSNSAFPSDFVQAIRVDKTGAVWYGTAGKGPNDGGLVKYKDSVFTVYDTSNSSIPSVKVWDVLIDDTLIWAGTQGGLAKFDGNNWVVYDTINSDIPDNYVNAMIKDSSGNMWVATENGLGKLNIETETWKNYTSQNSGLPNDQVWSVMYEPGTKNLWAGTYQGIGIVDSMENWEILDSTNTVIPSNSIYEIKMDADNNIWIATGRGVVFMEDTSKKDTVGLILENFEKQNWEIYYTHKQIQINNFQNKNLTKVELYNLKGQLVQEWNNSNFNGNSNETSLEVKNLRNGVYFVKLITSLGSKTQKIILFNGL
ncbi:MAG: T9SS type A sorting domain-containing protein [Bacteroidia bacterium]|nr:T9SS type A sorting domain-containing protein [Bacteroidia bacterium]